MVKSICIKFTYLIAQYYFVPLNQHAMQFSGSFMNSTLSQMDINECDENKTT